MWFVVFALVLAPILVALTHAPSAIALSDASLAHGHAHADVDVDRTAGHDATDHEHHSETVLAVSGWRGLEQMDDHSTNVVLQVSEHSPHSLRRPPRLV
ncbi:hypothetical protein [Gemmobacter nanjingensis]|uniref:hypothetical protein n=1 Tax=Gemmobacter nanjingensis TaxID=488454 RepID=UPI00167248E4|nr:hypothetical protein [Gemmobacter nanjingensis]